MSFIERSLPPSDRDESPALKTEWHAPTLAPIAILEGCDEDMQAIGAALLDAFRAYVQLADGNTACSKLDCHMAANKLQRLLSPAFNRRVARVTAAVKAST